MELKITHEIQNPLFDRKEITGTLNTKSIPQRQEILKVLAKEYSVTPESIRVLSIKGSFGSDEVITKANIYASKEQRDQYEKLTKREQEAEAKLNVPVEEKASPDVPSEEGKEGKETKTEEAK